MILRYNSSDVARLMKNGNLLEAGGHDLLIYSGLDGLRQIFSAYAQAFLPQNEIILFATQFDGIDRFKQMLETRGVDVSRHIDKGTLFIIDAQKGYQGGDSRGTFKLAMTVVERVKKEKRRGLTWFGDVGSFFAFERIQELVNYELSCPAKFEHEMKAVCCYHKADFNRLDEQLQIALIGHHGNTILAN